MRIIERSPSNEILPEMFECSNVRIAFTLRQLCGREPSSPGTDALLVNGLIYHQMSI